MNKIYKLALFGNPIGHSLSPKIHKQFASQFGLEISYELIQTNDKGLELDVISFFDSGGFGANVTVPHKNNIIDFIWNTTDIANESQAINTLYMSDQSEISGDNTDGIGLLKDLENRCDFSCENKKILILGAGGAVQGIVPAIMLRNPSKLVIANRSVNRAKYIACYPNSSAVSLDELKNLDDQFDLIIHASSLGYRGEYLRFYKHQVKENTVCYDLSYGEAAQAFIDYSKSMNVNKTYDGIGMLVEQAARSFEVWFKQKPETKDILNQLL